VNKGGVLSCIWTIHGLGKDLDSSQEHELFVPAKLRTLSESAQSALQSDPRPLLGPPPDKPEVHFDAPPLTDRIGGAFPLSPGQKSLWFMQQILPESAVYHIALCVRIRSPLDSSALQTALQTIVDRHDSLRTVFGIDGNGELIQKTHARGPVAFEVIDTSGLSRDEIDALVTAAFRQPFDLAAGPLFRSHLFTDRTENHLLLITAHHLVFDALSLLRVFTELLELYTSARSGRPHALLPVTAEYRDFVEWQSRMLAGPEGEAHVVFWREQLEGAPPILDLPTDHPRPLHPRGRGGSLWFKIARPLVEVLKTLAADLGINLFDVFAAVWQVLLYRYSGQPDVLAGFVTSGRPNLRYGRTTGPFSNTIVLRGHLSDDPTAAQFLRRQHETLVQCLAHQDYPFPLVVEKLNAARVPGYMPLTQVLFTYFMGRSSQVSELFVTGHAAATVETEAFALESYGLKQEDVEFDLAMSVAEGERCWGRLRFDADLFDQSTVERIGRHYLNLLHAVGEDPSRTVSSLPLLAPAERDEILYRWNRTPADYPANTTAFQLFQAQAEAGPDRVAVICGDLQLTYAELNARAESLSADLRQAGAGKGSLVGICLERSIDMLVALLAVWRAGAVYVPLDPHAPRPRLDLILLDLIGEDATPATIVTEEALRDLFAAGASNVIEMDPYQDHESAASASFPEPAASGSDLCYVLYTSGSTGRPKGVEVPHSALTNLLLSMRTRPGIDPSDVLLAVTTLSFDIAGLELFLPLISGATVVIATGEDVIDGRRLAFQIQNHGVTIMQATPATWRLLIDSGWTGCARLKALCGGEALQAELARKLLPRVASLWNMYGPTETTIWSTVHEVRTVDDPVPLGSAIDNTTLYILDPNLEPVPAGVAGELHIGGVGLARGYRNLPDLTESRFIAHPFLPGERLYKTGDLCRFRADSAILFLGRLDDQVKLRGHRIEPGEIESLLLRHPAVHQAAVVIHEPPDGSKQLVGYLVSPADIPHATSAALRESLSAQLPEYMIPSAFTYLDSMPLTRNGKVDRGALRVRSVAAPPEERGYIAPRNPTEAAIAGLWAEMLKTRGVGVHDRFDELGGDSLNFALMTIRAGSRLGIKIPVSIDPEMLTVAGFSRVAERIASEQAAVTAVALASPRPEPLAKSWYGRWLVRACEAIVRSVIRIEVDGLENLPARGPAIIASNHVSLFDFVILGAAFGNGRRQFEVTPTFVIADKWRWLAQPYASQWGHAIYIRRGMGDMEALGAARGVLEDRGLIAMMPEGRPTRGSLTRAKPGIAYLATTTGAAVLPLAIFGHDRILDSLKQLRRVPVRIRLGKCIYLHPVGERDSDFQQGADFVMKAIAAMMPPEYHGLYSETGVYSETAQSAR
jgi:amino acid adenylation domain-containing protein